MTERDGHMMAAVLHGREDLKIQKVAIPAVGPEDLLVRVKVALTCGTDFKVWKQGYHARMIVTPAIFGHELAGVVEDAGAAAKERFPRGIRVVAVDYTSPEQNFLRLRRRANLSYEHLVYDGNYTDVTV